MHTKTVIERSHVNDTWLLEVLVATGNIDEAFKFGIQALAQLCVHFQKAPNLIYAVLFYLFHSLRPCSVALTINLTLVANRVGVEVEILLCN